MLQGGTRGQLLVAAHTLALWPVWIWYIKRLQDGSDEPWGILALGTVLVFAGYAGKPRKPSEAAQLQCAVLLAAYCLAQLFAPPLIRAIVGVTSFASLLGAVYFGRALHLGISALCVLSLPLIASLQFYGGYPIRILTAECSSVLLRSVGYFVTREGTGLRYLGEIVSVDAPCSGIKMLWSGLYFNFALACFLRLSPVATWLSYVTATALIFGMNLTRATILFFGEARIVHYAPWMHQGIGLLLFALLVVFIFKAQLHIRYRLYGR